MSATKHALSVASTKIPRFRVRKVDPEYEKIRAQQRSIKRTQVENDLVRTVPFLSSPESDFMTGQTPQRRRWVSFRWIEGEQKAGRTKQWRSDRNDFSLR